MNQSYAEAGVKRKDTPLTMLLRVLMFLGIAVGMLLLLVGSFFTMIGAALIVVLFLMLPRLNVEYEYVFVDGQIDFDRITGKSKRKTMFRIDMEQVDIIALEGSHALDGYTYIKCESKDFSSASKDSKPYIIIANKDNKKYRIAFEPNELMLTMMKNKSPRKVSQI